MYCGEGERDKILAINGKKNSLALKIFYMGSLEIYDQF